MATLKIIPQKFSFEKKRLQTEMEKQYLMGSMYL